MLRRFTFQPQMPGEVSFDVEEVDIARLVGEIGLHPKDVLSVVIARVVHGIADHLDAALRQRFPVGTEQLSDDFHPRHGGKDDLQRFGVDGRVDLMKDGFAAGREHRRHHLEASGLPLGIEDLAGNGDGLVPTPRR